MNQTPCVFLKDIESKKFYKNYVPLNTISSNKFEDQYFRPEMESILGVNEDGSPKEIKDVPETKRERLQNLVWKRATEIFPNALLFDTSIEITDVNQGSVGDCYFLSALAAMCLNPASIYRLFRTKEVSRQGYYEVYLFLQGEWQIIVVDDYLPVRSNGNLYGASPKKLDLWIVILEKAFAKACGCYMNLTAGIAEDAFEVLLGVKTSYFKLEPTVKVDFEVIKKSLGEGNLIITGTSNNTSKEKGLRQSHMYTLADAFEVVSKAGKRSKILQIRNPWGHGEWVGSFSNGSVELIGSAQKVTLSMTDCGTFFMPLEEYEKEFDAFSIADLRLDYNYMRFPTITGDLVSKGHVFNLKVTEATSYTFNLHLVTEKFLREVDKSKIAVILIGKYDDNKDIKFYKIFSKLSQRSYAKYEMTKGNYVIWIGCNWFEKQQDPITEMKFRIYSTAYFSATYEGIDQDYAVVTKIMLQLFNLVYKKEIAEDKNYYLSLSKAKVYGYSIGFSLLVNKSSNQKLIVKVHKSNDFYFLTDQVDGAVIEVYPNQQIFMVGMIKTTTTCEDMSFFEVTGLKSTFNRFENFQNDVRIEAAKLLRVKFPKFKESNYSGEGFSKQLLKFKNEFPKIARQKNIKVFKEKNEENEDNFSMCLEKFSWRD